MPASKSLRDSIVALETLPGIGSELTQLITNGDTTHAPSGDALFDALALKALKSTAIATADVSATAAADSAITAEADATDLATVLTLANDLKAKYNAAVTLINELKSDLAEARDLANATKAKVNVMNA